MIVLTASADVYLIGHVVVRRDCSEERGLACEIKVTRLIHPEEILVSFIFVLSVLICWDKAFFVLLILTLLVTSCIYRATFRRGCAYA